MSSVGDPKSGIQLKRHDLLEYYFSAIWSFERPFVAIIGNLATCLLGLQLLALHN